MIPAPKIHRRTADDILKRVREIAPNYTREAWNAREEKGPGAALVKIFSVLLETIIQRLNRVPDKHFIKFLDRLGSRLLPPQPARAPVTFTLSEGAGEPVLIPARTQTAAGEVLFETETTFLATPARLVSAYSTKGDQIFPAPANLITGAPAPACSARLADPATTGDQVIFLETAAGLAPGDLLRIGDPGEYGLVAAIKDAKVGLRHGLQNGYNPGAPVEKITVLELFQGRDLQEHTLYLGHGDLLNVRGPATITLDMTAADPGLAGLAWEYYGEDASGQTDWHQFDKPDTSTGQLVLHKKFGEIKELEISGIKSRWIRCRCENLAEILGLKVSDLTGSIVHWIEKVKHECEFCKRMREVDLEISFKEVEEYLSTLDEQLKDNSLYNFLYIAQKYTSKVAKEIQCAASVIKAFLKAISEFPQNNNDDFALEPKPKNVTFETVLKEIKRFMEILDVDESGKIMEFLKIPEKDLAGKLKRADLPRFDLFIRAFLQNLIDRWGSPLGILPDSAFYNDTPLDLTLVNAPFYPLGKTPKLFDTFYLASRDAFSKAGGEVTLHISGTMASGGNPTPAPWLSWEYWGGSGWLPLPGIQEDLLLTMEMKTITIKALPAIQPVKVNGQENFWIRVKLVGGHYGQEVFVSEKEVQQGTVTPPEIFNLRISYELAGQRFDRTLLHNNLEFKAIENHGKGFIPFETLEESQGSLYLGFDRTMARGPISIFFDLEEQDLRGAEVKVAWSYFAEAGGTYRWAGLDTLDGTACLTRSGTVEFLFPEDFIQSTRFGEARFWIKAVDLKTRPTNPRIQGIYLNTTWSVQAASINREILGSGEGNPNQTFEFSKTPVLSAEVWVNEINALSEAERQQMLAASEPAVLEVKDEKSAPVEFWVKWTAVEDLLSSPPEGRHYELDCTAGLITFGDGIHGRMPPVGRDNVTANYRTGGGAQGNVAALQVNTLKTAIAYVDKVFNPIAAGGGSEPEALTAALDRSAHALKNRNRAITAEDFEYLVREASRQIARVKCLPNLNQERKFESGWVTVIIIPTGREAKPYPSLQLKAEAENYLRDRAAGPVIGLANKRLCISGPDYVEVAVTATVVARTMADAPMIEREAVRRLREFLHPLRGGDEGRGWDFGRAPYASDFYAILEKIQGVDHLEALEITVSRDQGGKIAPEALKAHEMVSSGEHAITVKV